ncbi:hypothetical protein M3Y97_00425100 [Aphelenchoides bicaudatus]|nr:hypothetical protein M3Y97_00425100 [Aphelenchoides bicaudatus]
MHSLNLSCLIVFFLIGLSLVESSCKITLKVRSATKEPFQLQVYIPSMHLKTERVTFEGKGVEKKVHIAGANCMDKRWLVKTWKSGEGGWVPAAHTSGKLGGIGTFRLVVDEKLKPHGHDRMGVMCSESDGPLCG